ncbi:MAG: hypothetical protein ACLUD0_04525 [Eubacterium ramulus]
MNTLKLHKLGIDIGSTTVKIAILDEQNTLVFSDYERHFANIRETLTDLLHKAYEKLGQIQLCPMITGSGWSRHLPNTSDVPFAQEGYRRIYRPADAMLRRPMWPSSLVVRMPRSSISRVAMSSSE